MDAKQYWLSRSDEVKARNNEFDIMDAYDRGLNVATEQNQKLSNLLFEINDYHVPAGHPDDALVTEAIREWEYTKP